MKKIITLTVSLAIAVLCFAQPSGRGERKTHDEVGFNRMQSEKIGFLTTKLDLTTDEAAQFFPIYNQFTKESMEAHRATMEALWSMKGKKGEELSDSELEKRIDAYVKAQQDEQSLINGYVEKFKKVLPTKKLAQFFLAEEQFRIRMINQLREPRPGKREGGEGELPAPRPEED